MSDFHSKIVIKKVVNGEPHIIERSFDNQDDYNKFIQDNNLDLNWGRDYSPALPSRNNFRGDIMDPFTRPLGYTVPVRHLPPAQTGNQILDKYAHKQYELRSKKLHNQKEIQELKKTIAELQKMKKEFESDGDQDTV